MILYKGEGAPLLPCLDGNSASWHVTTRHVASVTVSWCITTRPVRTVASLCRVLTRLVPLERDAPCPFIKVVCFASFYDLYLVGCHVHRMRMLESDGISVIHAQRVHSVLSSLDPFVLHHPFGWVLRGWPRGMVVGWQRVGV